MVDRYIYWVVMAAIFLLQLLLCLKVNRIILKLIPLLLLLLFMAFCVVEYAISGWNNWAFLILLLFLSIPFGAICAGWLVYGITKIAKMFRLSRKNT